MRQVIQVEVDMLVFKNKVRDGHGVPSYKARS